MNYEELARLFDDHAAALELYLRQWTGDPADVVQSAFIRLAEQQPPPRRVVPWLYRVARNLAISQVRAESVRRKHERQRHRETGSWFRERSGRTIDTDDAVAALRELADDDREIVMLRIWSGLTFNEIALVTGTPRATVHRKYTDALAKLKERLVTPCPTNPSNRS